MAAGGDFSQLELSIKKRLEMEQTIEVTGGYVTEIYLANVRYWDPEMIENSRQWAKARGLWRMNAVHGKDEWKLPLDETYSFKTKKSEIVEVSGSSEMEAGCLLFKAMHRLV